MKLRSQVLAVSIAAVLLAGMAVAQGTKNSSKHATKNTAAAEQSVTGEVSDTMCGKKHMMADASAAACTRA